MYDLWFVKYDGLVFDSTGKSKKKKKMIHHAKIQYSFFFINYSTF